MKYRCTKNFVMNDGHVEAIVGHSYDFIQAGSMKCFIDESSVNSKYNHYLDEKDMAEYFELVEEKPPVKEYPVNPICRCCKKYNLTEKTFALDCIGCCRYCADLFEDRSVK